MSPPELTLSVSPDHPALAGHFPGRPIVPGVVWLERVLGLARSRLELPRGTTRWPRVKFLRPVPPGCDLFLDLSAKTSGFSFTLKDAHGRRVVTGRCEVHEPLD